MTLASPPIIACRCLTKKFDDLHSGEQVHALTDFTLDVATGEFLVILGPSGCGKTTVLNIIAGFERPSTGEVLFQDQAIRGPGADRGVVFQEYALFPWLNLKQNVLYGLRERGTSLAEAVTVAAKFIAMVGLTGFEHHFPHELSGGMRQRAALARVLVNNPRVLLMDEPFAALDAFTRSGLQRELSRIWEETGKTVVFITHSVEEAVLLADRVVVMTRRPGRIDAVIPITLARPRDPTSPDFNSQRQKLEAYMRRMIQEGEEA